MTYRVNIFFLKVLQKTNRYSSGAVYPFLLSFPVITLAISSL